VRRVADVNRQWCDTTGLTERGRPVATSDKPTTLNDTPVRVSQVHRLEAERLG